MQEDKNKAMNKTIFITGASSGLGKITAKLFAERGWTVIATMRKPDSETELSQLPNIHLLQLDVSDPGQINDVAAKAEQIGPIDVLFNNAGYVLAGALEATSDEQMEQQFNTNVFGPIRLARAFLPYFRERGKGTIITTTSLGAYIPDPFMSMYAATKSALETWTEGMSYELDRLGIKIKTIVPGFMETNFVANAQMTLHDAYQDDWNKVLAAYANPGSAMQGDDPADIARVIYEAATDDKKQLHYFAGNDATTRHNELLLEGINSVLNKRKKAFLGN
ncbi:short-subunit dehydrogenase [Chitinophaga terrae (ex Kim and Jung 2007)]|uniref:SDR family oxidoreductase n=1 Tax=Chitinophaga terrae (ex Kim and Jung 2007) TaxID=408074 RepID=UPI0027847587|nr:SDR family oxidoreductase [Chitinophaga terrae (ex Kim and Jung 2007)]MDQ0110041.1 short-subunit dehydrogenase [Chitinophaga terrae (ex Kim and Jung 2007)]